MLINALQNRLFKTRVFSVLLMTMVPLSHNGAAPIFSYLLVLTYEKNRLEFSKISLETAL